METAMLLRMNDTFEIDNPRNYGAALVDELRASLARGAWAHPDPKRQGFYDIEVEGRVFFIWVPSSGAVTLLAAWSRSGAQEDSSDEVQFHDLSVA
jgi:hypothetical protein